MAITPCPGHAFFGRPADAAERRRHPASLRWGAGQRGAEVRPWPEQQFCGSLKGVETAGFVAKSEQLFSIDQISKMKSHLKGVDQNVEIIFRLP